LGRIFPCLEWLHDHDAVPPVLRIWSTDLIIFYLASDSYSSLRVLSTSSNSYNLLFLELDIDASICHITSNWLAHSMWVLKYDAHQHSTAGSLLPFLFWPLACWF
jgi:hypothetical protein